MNFECLYDTNNSNWTPNIYINDDKVKINVTILYRSSCEDKDQDTWGLFVQISNITKGITLMYNPVVYCKPKVDEDVVWLSSHVSHFRFPFVIGILTICKHLQCQIWLNEYV